MSRIESKLTGKIFQFSKEDLAMISELVLTLYLSVYKNKLFFATTHRINPVYRKTETNECI